MSYNNLNLKKTKSKNSENKQPFIWKLTFLISIRENISLTITQKVYTVQYGLVDSFNKEKRDINATGMCTS